MTAAPMLAAYAQRPAQAIAFCERAAGAFPAQASPENIP
jgi:hypothetical protein